MKKGILNGLGHHLIEADPFSFAEHQQVAANMSWYLCREHAFYLQYKNVKPEYLKNIWQVINWKTVADRYSKAKSGGQ